MGLLKRVPLLDVSAVAALFVLRALAGALAIGVVASPWIFVCTLAGALFVASAAGIDTPRRSASGTRSRSS